MWKKSFKSDKKIRLLPYLPEFASCCWKKSFTAAFRLRISSWPRLCTLYVLSPTSGFHVKSEKTNNSTGEKNLYVENLLLVVEAINILRSNASLRSTSAVSEPQSKKLKGKQTGDRELFRNVSSLRQKSQKSRQNNNYHDYYMKISAIIQAGIIFDYFKFARESYQKLAF